jgi:hypothetical protein
LKAEWLNSTKESTTSNGASLQQASCKGKNPTLLAVSTEAGSIFTKTCNIYNDAWALHARCKGKFPSLLAVLTAAGFSSTTNFTTSNDAGDNENQRTIEEFCNRLHKSILAEFSHAWVWGRSAKHQPRRCGKDHVLEDEDIVSIVKKVNK